MFSLVFGTFTFSQTRTYIHDIAYININRNTFLIDLFLNTKNKKGNYEKTSADLHIFVGLLTFLTFNSGMAVISYTDQKVNFSQRILSTFCVLSFSENADLKNYVHFVLYTEQFSKR